MTKPLSAETLAAIEDRWLMATKGLIAVGAYPRLTDFLKTDDVPAGVTFVGTMIRNQDAAFVGSAYDDIPVLIAEVKRLRAELNSRDAKPKLLDICAECGSSRHAKLCHWAAVEDMVKQL